MDRIELQQRLFPAGIPKLWCPTLSFFSAAETFDADRIEQHLQRLAPHVRGLLVPGSTGEGWEMSDAQIMELLHIVIPIAGKLNMRVLIGILKTDTGQVLKAIDQLDDLLSATSVVGITVCPPKGAQLSPMEIETALNQVLDRRVPTALYQLPQVTENEMGPDMVARLAQRYPNFIMFKDTSGLDRVAQSGVDLEGVFLVRGAEKGGYSSWLRCAGGNYDGFLLSTANCFAPELHKIIELCESRKLAEAEQLSQKISSLVTKAFELAGQVPFGNAFTNANKAIDFLLHSSLETDPAPMLFSGQRLPQELLKELSRTSPKYCLIQGR